MKKVVSIFTAVLLSMCMTFPVLAADFTPSVPGKDHPEVVPTPEGNIAVICDENGAVIGYLEEDCIVVTSVAEAETSTKIPQDAKETLLDVYADLTSGDMQLPYEKVDESLLPENMVIRDLFDVSLLCTDHPEMLKQGYHLVIDFDLGVDANTEIVAMIYDNGEWYPAVGVVNNGDGTITLTMDRVGVVAFSVNREIVSTGDTAGPALVLWSVLMAVSAVALVVLVVSRRKVTHE